MAAGAAPTSRTFGKRCSAHHFMGSSSLREFATTSIKVFIGYFAFDSHPKGPQFR
jgi:hypothetical protein